MEPTLLVEIKKALRETFGYWALKVKAEGEGENFFAYNAINVIQEISRTWSSLYKVIAAFCDEEMKQIKKARDVLSQANKIHEILRHKLKGELLQLRSQKRVLQDRYAACGLSITTLESKLSALSLQSLAVGDKAKFMKSVFRTSYLLILT